MNEIQTIQSKIYEIRGQRVMLDRDLAELYQVTTGNLNKAVKRNIRRFPPDFMFQLTKDEFNRLKSDLIFQNGTSNWGGTRKLPYAFTEQGLAMLSLSLASCDSNDKKEGDWDSMIWEAEAQVQKTDGIYHVPTDGGTMTFTCHNYSAPWIENAESGGNYYFPSREEGIYHSITMDWFKAEIVGNKLNVTFDSNENNQARPLKLEVTAGDIFYTFKFEQSAK